MEILRYTCHLSNRCFLVSSQNAFPHHHPPQLHLLFVTMMTSSHGKKCPRCWPFERGIHRWPVNSPHTGQWRVALCAFFDLRLNKRLSKPSRRWWFETPLCSLWRHCNGHYSTTVHKNPNLKYVAADGLVSGYLQPLWDRLINLRSGTRQWLHPIAHSRWGCP